MLESVSEERKTLRRYEFHRTRPSFAESLRHKRPRLLAIMVTRHLLSTCSARPLPPVAIGGAALHLWLSSTSAKHPFPRTREFFGYVPDIRSIEQCTVAEETASVIYDTTGLIRLPRVAVEVEGGEQGHFEAGQNRWQAYPKVLYRESWSRVDVATGGDYVDYNLQDEKY